MNLCPETGQDKYKPSENILCSSAEDVLPYIVKGIFINIGIYRLNDFF